MRFVDMSATIVVGEFVFAHHPEGTREGRSRQRGGLQSFGQQKKRNKQKNTVFYWLNIIAFGVTSLGGDVSEIKLHNLDLTAEY